MWLCMTKPDIHQFKDELNLCPYCLGPVTTITEVDMELQRRKHNKSLFGTVPQRESVIYIRALADKVEKLLKDKDPE